MDIVFLFYDGMTPLDAIGPHEILWRLPEANVLRAAVEAGPIKTGSDLILNADYSLKDVSKADVLVVPGSGSATALRDVPETLAWIRKIHSTTKWTTSVCTGSLILAAAGILDDIRATTHWAVFDRLQALGAKATHGRVIEDGKIITAAGVSAGLDMGLMLAAKIAGIQEAEALQLIIEYDPAPPFNTGAPDKVDHILLENVKARVLANFEHS